MRIRNPACICMRWISIPIYTTTKCSNQEKYRTKNIAVPQAYIASWFIIMHISCIFVREASWLFMFLLCYLLFSLYPIYINRKYSNQKKYWTKKIAVPQAYLASWFIFMHIPAYSLEKHHGYLCFSFVIFPLLFEICYLILISYLLFVIQGGSNKSGIFYS